MTRPGVAVVAHRGDPYHHRENTLPSIRSALAKGADVVEVDVKLTSDKVPVLLHDVTLERLWRDPSPVAVLSADELHKATGGGVPSLADGLAELRAHDGGARMLLDLTDTDQAAVAVAAVQDAGLGERVYYCGQLAAMRAVRALDADAEVAMTWTTSVRPAQSLLTELRPRWINLRFGLVDSSTVAWASGHGLLVAAWTADWERSMSRLIGYGVHAITTNRLSALQRVVARRAR